MSFSAKYPGRCGHCDNRIEPGQQVRYEDDELVHDDCVPTPDLDAPRRNERACMECWTTHAGECA